MKELAYLAATLIASFPLPVAAKTVAVEVNADQAKAEKGAVAEGSDIEIAGGRGEVVVPAAVPHPGEYQVWLSYAYPIKGTARVSVTAMDGQKLTSPLQHTATRKQYFREYLGTFQVSQPGDFSLRITVEKFAIRFLFHRLELVQVPVLSEELEPLFHASINFNDKLLRVPNGLYRDVHLVQNTGRKRNRKGGICSIAAVGVGLMSLCMSHELGSDPNAEAKALKTLQTVNGKTSGLKPDREKAGFFRHFIDISTGNGKSEFSTIDTAILVVGALYCRNTFDDPRIREEADLLWNSIDWSVALADPQGEQLYMVVEDGAPVATSKTRLFNEYYILAWLIQQAQLQEYEHSDVLRFQLDQWSHLEMTLLCARHPRPQCSFLVQFPLYMCHPCTHSKRYFSFASAQARADQLTCAERVGVEEFWGCGAGGTPNDGYHASNYGKNPSNVVSPRIIGGFLPVYPQAQDHLLKLYRDPARRLKTEAGDLLPRFSVDEPTWRHHRIESIDFSSMLFGLAAIHPKLGMEFFRDKTRFTFDQ